MTWNRINLLHGALGLVAAGLLAFPALARPACPADTDGDGYVDVQDVVHVVGLWGTDGIRDGIMADCNYDGIVDVQDLIDVVLNWGKCPF